MIGLTTAVIVTVASQAIPPFDSHQEPLSDKVTLALTTDRSVYYAGEALHLRLTLHNFSERPVVGAFTLEPTVGKTSISYRLGGASFKPLSHLYAGRNSGHHWARLEPDAKLTHEFVVAADPTTQLPLLNETGEYDFLVKYSDLPGPSGLLVSNVLHVSVVDVPADQREALAAYRQGLAFFAEFDPRRRHTVTPAQIQAGADFLQKFRGSLYWRDVLDGVWKAVAERSLSKVASESEEALLKKIREEWADATPPTLSLSATPSSLWPPNHKLVPVTVTVNVTDDQDANPDVKLVSITCDDGCNPALDIAGVTLNTDDRDFELRAERLGTGSGRTYTITYSASDAGGNTGTATVTVMVPHDQGVAKKE